MLGNVDYRRIAVSDLKYFRELGWDLLVTTDPPKKPHDGTVIVYRVRD